MSSDSVDKKSPDSQVKAAQAVGNNNQLKYPHGSERISFGALSSQKSQEMMTNAVITTPNSNLPKSPKLHAASVRKSQSVVSKKSSSFSSNKKQKAKLKKQTASSTSAGHSDSVRFVHRVTMININLLINLLLCLFSYGYCVLITGTNRCRAI